jgi:predicted phosphodiesterase
MNKMAAELLFKGQSRRQVTDALNDQFNLSLNSQAVRKHLNRLGYHFHPNARDFHADTATIKMTSDGVQDAQVLVALKHQPDKSPDTLMKLCGYDPTYFELVSGEYKVYEQHSRAAGTVPQYAIHVKVRPRLGITTDELAAVLNEKVKPVYVVKEVANHDPLNNLVIPLFDLHFGITHLAQLVPILAQLKAIFDRQNYNRVVIELGGDTLRSDFMEKTQTAKNTQLDHVDTMQAWEDAKRFVGTIIQASLANAAHVDLYAIPGNHDSDMQWAFVDGLADRYPQLTVHNTTAYRQAYQIGNVGILLAHGDVALKKLPMLFATEYSSIWADTNWREIHYGHFHHEVTDDENGVILRQMGTPKPSDNYEKKNGYTMAHHILQVYEYSTNRLELTYTLGGEQVA